MKKRILWVVALALITGAVLFNSCEKKIDVPDAETTEVSALNYPHRGLKSSGTPTDFPWTDAVENVSVSNVGTSGSFSTTANSYSTLSGVNYVDQNTYVVGERVTSPYRGGVVSTLRMDLSAMSSSDEIVMKVDIKNHSGSYDAPSGGTNYSGDGVWIVDLNDQSDIGIAGNFSGMSGSFSTFTIDIDAAIDAAGISWSSDDVLILITCEGEDDQLGVDNISVFGVPGQPNTPTYKTLPPPYYPYMTVEFETDAVAYADDYEWTVTTTPSGRSWSIIDNDGEVCAIQLLSASTQYHIKVRASNDAGDGAWSSAYSVGTY
jgi:hypothetical protein